MHFIDEAKIYLKAGNGGAGACSFRREKFIEFGGPDGGHGGRGGDIIFIATKELNTLIDFRYKQHFRADIGGHGMGRNRTGKAGEDMIIMLPVGTQVFDEESNIIIADLTSDQQTLVIAKGGRGGAGNAVYKSSTNQAPYKSKPGEEGEELWIWLKLKLLSDVAGKSSFLAAVTAAQPKVADYPFTTLKPQLGVATCKDEELVIADLPGLIEGASEGHGLGDKFLKHIERCRVLIHLIDITGDVVANYQTIRYELNNYSPLLQDKQEIIALNKIDLVDEEFAEDMIKAMHANAPQAVIFLCSGAGRIGLEAILESALEAVKSQY